MVSPSGGHVVFVTRDPPGAVQVRTAQFSRADATAGICSSKWFFSFSWSLDVTSRRHDDDADRQRDDEGGKVARACRQVLGILVLRSAFFC